MKILAASQHKRQQKKSSLLTIENTDSDLKVHALHYANELLVRVRLSFQKLLQTRQTSRNNIKKLAKTGFGYDKALFFNSQINSIPEQRVFLHKLYS